MIMEEAFDLLDAPVLRVSTHAIPLPACSTLEDLALPSVERVMSAVLSIQ
jgi:pyruvate dehydrogenase E1 component beta subunit